MHLKSRSWPAARVLGALALILAALAILAGDASRAAISSGERRKGERDVLGDRLWDDGRAEVSLYVGTTRRYGQNRPTRARVIVVKEDLLRSSLVKSEKGPIPGRTVTAIKQIFVADFRTGTYDYHQNASVFFERESGAVLKEAMSHTEQCGITYVRVAPERGSWLHEAHSYWEGEADREVPLRWPTSTATDRLFWDGLPVSLRKWVANERAPMARKGWMLPSQISGHAPLSATKPSPVAIRMSDGGTLRVPAGRFASRRFEIVAPWGTDVLWFDQAFPHVLLKMQTAAGRTLELERTMRLDYWNRNANGDERLLPEAAR